MPSLFMKKVGTFIYYNERNDKYQYDGKIGFGIIEQVRDNRINGWGINYALKNLTGNKCAWFNDDFTIEIITFE